MFDNLKGCLLSLGLIALTWIFLMVRKGPVATLGATVVLRFAFPVWLKVDVGGVPINVRTAIAVVNLASFLLRPSSFNLRGKILVPLTLLVFA